MSDLILMAPSRSWSFPQSRQEELQRSPPFGVNDEDAAKLIDCQAFQGIRDLLKCGRNRTFCTTHHTSNKTHREAWLLQRDITFALLFPLLQVYRQARDLALSIRGKRHLDDLELLFSGEARGAFAWLQCFLAAESEWCAATGCPACHVCYVLQTEPTIRIILSACRLAQSLRRPSGQTHDTPVFDFWLTTLRRALDKDSFWGPSFWKTVEPRASDLERGIFAMASQCCAMQERIASSDSGASMNKPPTSMIRQSSMPQAGSSKKGAGKGKYIEEEGTWLQNIVIGCWTTLVADAKHSATGNPSRPSPPIDVGRSVTC